MPKLVRYGISDEQAWSVGLACGSTIEVLIEPELRAEVEAAHARATIASCPVELPDGSGRFEELFPAPRRLVVVRRRRDRAAAVRLAHELGYRVVVVDARSAFATAERFPEADDLIVGWPDEVAERVCLAASDAVAVAGPRPQARRSGAAAGVRGGLPLCRRVGQPDHAGGTASEVGGSWCSAADIARLHGPIGLDLGGREPAETALAIMAEVVADRYGGERPRQSA